MTTKIGRIVVNSRPTGLYVYLDGKPILDSSGRIAKTPIIILNVTEGVHNVTFSKPGYDDTTIMVEVQEGLDCDARAILSTRSIRYPMMLSQKEQSKSSPNPPGSLQPAPGWPALPIPQIPYGYLVANTIPDGAEIYIDGQAVFDTVGKVLTTPVTIINITTGRHKITFIKDRYFDEDVYVYVENGLYSDAFAILRPKMVAMSHRYRQH